MHIRVLGSRELRVYFGSDISELHCRLSTDKNCNLPDSGIHVTSLCQGLSSLTLGGQEDERPWELGCN